MASLLEKILPIPLGFHIWDMANGNEYTIDDDSTELTPELAESDLKTDKAYDERYRQQPKKGNGGKGKSQFKEETKVETSQLKKEQVVTKKEEKTTGDKELVD